MCVLLPFNKIPPLPSVEPNRPLGGVYFKAYNYVTRNDIPGILFPTKMYHKYL
jgi:hypothetical protein